METNGQEWLPATTSALDVLVKMHNPTDRVVTATVTVPCRKIVRSAPHPVTGDVDELLVENEERTLQWAPGETKAVPESIVRALHSVFHCPGTGEHKKCLLNGRPGRCKSPATAGPKAVLRGGLAHMLRRVDPDQQYTLDRSLLPVPEKVPVVAAPAGDVVAAVVVDDVADPTLERARQRRRSR